MDLIEKYPKATIVVQFPAHEEELNWKDIKDWYILSRHQLILCLGNIDDIKQAVELNIPCVIECVIDREDKVFPMVPAGAPISDVFDGDDLKKKGEQ